MIEFPDIGNYRGNLIAKQENGKYWLTVDCDMESHENLPWIEILESTYISLTKDLYFVEI